MSILKRLFIQLRRQPRNSRLQAEVADNLHGHDQPEEIDEASRLAQQIREEGRSHEATGDLNGALASYFKALQLKPRNVALRVDLASVLQATGDFDEAHKHLLEAQRLDKKNPSILSQLGYLSLSLGNLDAAARRCQEAIDIDPGYAPAWNNLGIAAMRGGKVSYAINCFKKSTEANPTYGMAWSNLGLAYREAEDVAQSIAALQRALELRPNHAPTHLNLSTLLTDCGSLEEAELLLKRAKELDPDLAEVNLALGAISLKRGNRTAAERFFLRALENDPNNAEARAGVAETQLLAGNFSEGWDNYEARLDSQESPRKVYPYTLWKGESLAGKSLLIYAEQGVGDIILFMSCVPDIVAQAGHIIIESGPKLFELFTNSFPTVTVVEILPGGTESKLLQVVGHVDYYIAAGSLFHILRREKSAFPGHQGYLKPSLSSKLAWQKRLAGLGPGLKVGIAWKGGLLKTGRQQRSLILESLLPLLSVPGIHYVSLQHNDFETEMAELERDHGIKLTLWPDAFANFNELGALVSSLDLVVTVCSSLAHLTGALGVPGFVLAPTSPTWRYLGSGESLPWYPSIRLFRQEGPGTWGSAITRLENEIRALTEVGHG